MTPAVEIRMPAFPDCWNSCGSCKSDAVSVQSVLISEGDLVAEYDPLIVLETAKTALEIPSPLTGTIIRVCVSEYDPIAPGDLIALVCPD